MPETLTDNESKVLKFIREFKTQYCYPPTLHDICEEFGWASSNSARKPIKKLVAKGYLERVDGVSRGIRIVNTEGAA
jgi:repressor LexA